jgi:HD-like signal output (HDOD) protein
MDDQQVMDQALAGRSVRPTDLPAPPNGAIRIVRACSDPDIDGRQLARIVANDPVLTAELLRVANSAYFGLANQVRSVLRAVTVLGHRALRNLVLCISMRDALRVDAVPGFDIDAYWEDALRRAVCARAVAGMAGLDGDECFTAGLLQDFGLLVLLYLMPEQVGHWQALATADPARRRELELELFQTTHDEVGLLLANNWDLPSDLALAMGRHHRGPSEDADREHRLLCHLCTCADWMAAAYRCDDKRIAIQRSRSLLAEYFGASAEQTDQVLEQVSGLVQEAAAAFGLQVGDQISFDAVLREANLKLAEENQSFQELTWQLERALAERDRIAAELSQELELAREVQKSLLPRSQARVSGIYGLNLSAKAVSGDFYDYYPIGEGRTAFCLADVSGKGMNAALLMAKTASLFRCLGKGIHDPGKLLGMINREIFETSIRGMFVTMQAGVIDRRAGRITLANAGHLPALHMGPASMIGEYPAEAPPLGISSDSLFPNQSFDVGDGCLYLYTDGLLEARVAGQRLEKGGLTQLLKAQSHLPIAERAGAISAAVLDESGFLEDDLTLLIIEGRVDHGLQ